MLSGAQLGITVTGLLVGYVAEPLIGESIGALLGGVDVPTGVAVGIGAVLALLFSPLVQMLFGELFPKNLAIARPEPVALWLATSTVLYLRLFGWLVRRTVQAGTDPVAAVDARTVEVRLSLSEEVRAALERRTNMQVQVAIRP